MANVPIPNPGWLSLLTRLGIQRFGAFFLGEVVVPVAVVDASAVTIASVSTPQNVGTPASAGEVVNPGAGAVMADTGALAAGTYTFTVWGGGNATHIFRIQRRDAANAADIWSAIVASGLVPSVWQFRITLAANERVRCVSAGVAGTIQNLIFVTAG